MNFRAIGIGLLLFSVPIAGCGTFKNNVMSPPEEGGKTPFGGVREDMRSIDSAESGKYCFTTDPKAEPEQKSQLGLMLLFAIDLPFSAIGDVVMLPYDLAYTWINEPIPVPAVLPPRPPALTQLAPPGSPTATVPNLPPPAPVPPVPSPSPIPTPAPAPSTMPPLSPPPPLPMPTPPK